MVGLFVVVILRLISEIRRPIFVFVCFGVLGLATVISLPLLVDLIFINDSVSFDSVRTSGRITIWQTLFDHWPSGVGGIIFGAGGGGARDLLISELNGFETGLLQPHNEYLRLAFDYGFVGLGLWLLFYFRVFKDHCDFVSFYSVIFLSRPWYQIYYSGVYSI